MARGAPTVGEAPQSWLSCDAGGFALPDGVPPHSRKAFTCLCETEPSHGSQDALWLVCVRRGTHVVAS